MMGTLGCPWSGVLKVPKVLEQRGVPYLLGERGGRGLPPLPGVPRLQGRAAPARAVGTGWLSLEERREPWPALTSALAPKSVPGLQGSGLGSVPTLGGEDFREQREPQELGPRGVPGVAQRHPPWAAPWFVVGVGC